MGAYVQMENKFKGFSLCKVVFGESNQSNIYHQITAEECSDSKTLIFLKQAIPLGHLKKCFFFCK